MRIFFFLRNISTDKVHQSRPSNFFSNLPKFSKLLPGVKSNGKRNIPCNYYAEFLGYNSARSHSCFINEI